MSTNTASTAWGVQNIICSSETMPITHYEPLGNGDDKNPRENCMS